jgi:hypothetical protein
VISGDFEGTKGSEESTIIELRGVIDSALVALVALLIRTMLVGIVLGL